MNRRLIMLAPILIFITLVLALPYEWIFAESSTPKTEKIVSVDRIHKLSGVERTGGYLVADGFDWSHNEKFVAFKYCTGIEPVCSLGIMSPDGSEVKNIKIPIRFMHISAPRISPSDDSVLFVGQYNDQNGTTHEDLLRYNIGDQRLVQITNKVPIGSYAWMPDGHIVYAETHALVKCLDSSDPVSAMPCFNESVQYTTALRLADSDGRTITVLYNGTNRFLDMDISPDGKKIVFTDVSGTMGHILSTLHYKLSILNLEKKEVRVMFESSDTSYMTARWSPNGKFILYDASIHQQVQGRQPGVEWGPAGLLGMISADGGINEVIYGSTKAPYTPPPFGLAASPDGKSIVFGITYDVLIGEIDGPGIYLMELSKPIPEFPVVPLVLSTSILALIFANRFIKR